MRGRIAMCLVVYVASDAELPTRPYDEVRPGLFIERVDPTAAPVRRHFRKPNIYRIGCHTGCGCGFQYGQYPEVEDDPEDLAAAETTRAALIRYLAEAVGRQPIELYACWADDEAKPQASRRDCPVAALFEPSGFLREREYLMLRVN
jgi:hypothetical protein